MSALPCSSNRPWLRNGSRPLGLRTSVRALRSPATLVLANSTFRPSLANRPSASATSSGRTWKGAVCSSTSVFIALFLRRNPRPRLSFNRAFSIRLAGAFDRGAQQQSALVRGEIGAGVTGAAFIPDDQVALAPHVGVNEFRPLRMIEKEIEQRVALRFLHPFDAHRHEPVDVERLALRFFVGARHRMHRLA